MKFLGIDPGKRYIGLAIADDQVNIAMPYQVLDIKENQSWLKELVRIINQEKILKIVIGHPVGLSGKPTEQTRITEQFIESLKETLNIPIISFDERLSSKMADKLLLNQKQNHSVAASIILQGYLDKQL